MSNPNETFRELKEEEVKIRAHEAICFICNKIVAPYIMVDDLRNGGKVPLCTDCILDTLEPITLGTE